MCLGVPARVLEVIEQQSARVDVNGNEVVISIRLIPEVEPGQYVLVHAGFAMDVIDENVALETMHYLEELIQYDEE